MENIFTEELRALFREIFKIEVKDVSSDIAFMGKIAGRKLNEERLTLGQKQWLFNIGALARDKKNIVELDDRTIFSHILSAIYGGMYGLNFIDVTAHCLETIKAKKGLKQNQNLVDYMSPKELRIFAIALYKFSNAIRALKNRGYFRFANMSNFYDLADKAFACGLNARSEVLNERSEFRQREFTSKQKAENTLENMEIAISQNNFSQENMKYQGTKNSKQKELVASYNKIHQQIFNLLKPHLNENEIKEVFASIDEGYYQTKYFRTHPSSIIQTINTSTSISDVDLSASNQKLNYAKILLSRLIKHDKSRILLHEFKNMAYKAGSRARDDCHFQNKTSPEYFTTFAQALVLDKQNERR